jgi:hypothetical protein
MNRTFFIKGTDYPARLGRQPIETIGKYSLQ